MSSKLKQKLKSMKLSELIDILRKKTNQPINQTMISKALGVTRQSINNRLRNNSEVTISELNKIEDFFNISLNSTPDTVCVDYYPEVFASCGSGTITFSEEKELLHLHKTILPEYNNSKKYSMIHAKGDSMSPYINDGDKLVVEHTDNEGIIDNKVYVFCYKSEIFVKRLSKNIDEIIIKSENPNYSSRIVKGEDMNDITIIGRIVSVLRTI